MMTDTLVFPCGHPQDKKNTFHGRNGWISCRCRIVTKAPTVKGPATTPAPNTLRPCRGCRKKYARSLLRKVKVRDGDNYYVCLVCVAKGVT